MSRFFKSKYYGNGNGASTREDESSSSSGYSLHSHHDGSDEGSRSSRNGTHLKRSPVLRRPSVDLLSTESRSLSAPNVLNLSRKNEPVPLPLPSHPRSLARSRDDDESRRSSVSSYHQTSGISPEGSTRRSRQSNSNAEEMQRSHYKQAQSPCNFELSSNSQLTVKTERGEGSGRARSVQNVEKSPRGQKSTWFTTPGFEYSEHSAVGPAMSSTNGSEFSLDSRGAFEANGLNSKSSGSIFYPLPHPLTMSSNMSTTAPSSPRLPPSSPRLAPPSPRLPPASPPRLSPPSPRMASPSPRMAPSSPRMAPSSPHMAPPSPRLTSAPKWHKGHLLGSGAFGRVYKGIHSETGEFCAIKEVEIIQDDTRSRDSARQLAQEIAFLSSFCHPNIVQYKGSEMVGDSFHIYLEYISGGSLYKVFQEFNELEEPVIRRYTKQILLGLEFLHKRNVIHRDIKCANILVDQDGVVKLADFGLAKYIREHGVPFSMKGSPYWMSPEVIKQKTVAGYEYAVDIWSLGCSVLEMATGRPPWSEHEGIVAMFKVTRGELPYIPEFLSDDAKSFIRLCLQKDPADRPTATELLQHAFVNVVNDSYNNTMVHAFEVLDSQDIEDMQMLSLHNSSDIQSSLSAPTSPRSSYAMRNALYPTRSTGFLTPPRGSPRGWQ